jgi:energy-coupling factor transporter ATP-binding protein EcfA2
MPLTIKMKSKFGPFDRMPSVELPDMSILTGLNGSGKTQLLLAMSRGNVEVSMNGQIVPPKEILYVATLTPSIALSTPISTAESHERNAQQLLAQFRQQTNQYTQALESLANRNAAATGWGARRQPQPSHMQQPQKPQPNPALLKFAQLLGKSPEDLLDQDVLTYAVASATEDSSQPFSSNLAHVSLAHLRTYYHQLLAKNAAQLGDNSLLHLVTADRDVSNRPPPWELASKILQPFGFHIEGAPVTLASAQRDLKLVFKRDGESVDPSFLSGGERLLLALAVAQYSAQAAGAFPKLLLLDESLSALHPSIAERALSILKKVFVSENNIRVVLVTHAPTLAIVAREPLFEVINKRPEIDVKPISADAAIGLLTIGIPTLRIDPANRRQVFVESDQDELVYSSLYEVLRPLLNPVVSLQFLSSGRAKQHGSRDRVVDLVGRLRDKGVSTVLGIIDWDGHEATASTTGVHTLAPNERYSLENLMLDPAIVAAVLAHSKEGRDALGGVALDTLTLLIQKGSRPSVFTGMCTRRSHRSRSVTQGASG